MIERNLQHEFLRIQPLLQDSRVQDEDLVTVLLEYGYSGLYLLAFLMLNDLKLAHEAVVNAVSVVVAQRRDYWGEVPLVVWINHLVLKECRQAIRKRIPGACVGKSELAESSDEEGEFSGIFLEQLVHLSEQQRAVLGLRYGQGIDLQDISAILRLPLIGTQLLLKNARQSFLEGIEANEGGGNAQASPGVQHTAFLEQIIQK